MKEPTGYTTVVFCISCLECGHLWTPGENEPVANPEGGK